MILILQNSCCCKWHGHERSCLQITPLLQPFNPANIIWLLCDEYISILTRCHIDFCLCHQFQYSYFLLWRQISFMYTLFGYSNKCVHEANLTPEQKIAVLKLMTQTKIDMASGQYADVLIAEKPDDISWVEWLKQRSYLKTRSLMAMPFTATAILQNQDHSSGVQLTECGHSLGTIYQIGDDVRDFEPEEGQVALSYPLAFLLDDDEQAVLSLISGGKIDTATAEQLGQILRGRKSQILRSAGSEIDELAQTAIDLPSGLQGR